MVGSVYLFNFFFFISVQIICPSLSLSLSVYLLSPLIFNFASLRCFLLFLRDPKKFYFEIWYHEKWFRCRAIYYRKIGGRKQMMSPQPRPRTRAFEEEKESRLTSERALSISRSRYFGGSRLIDWNLTRPKFQLHRKERVFVCIVFGKSHIRHNHLVPGRKAKLTWNRKLKIGQFNFVETQTPDFVRLVLTSTTSGLKDIKTKLGKILSCPKPWMRLEPGSVFPGDLHKPLHLFSFGIWRRPRSWTNGFARLVRHQSPKRWNRKMTSLGGIVQLNCLLLNKAVIYYRRL